MEIQNKKVTVFGCGWLGLPLAGRLAKNGFSVKGTTTTMSRMPHLSQEGIVPYHLSFPILQEPKPNGCWEADIYIVAIPPKSKSTDGLWYLEALQYISLMAQRWAVEKLIFLSSTSVYPDKPCHMDETFDLTEHTGNHVIQAAEKEFANGKVPAFILRLGGLAGDDRFLARHFSGKIGLKGGNYPVNLLHKIDALNAIQLFVQGDYQPGVYNICAPVHPTKQELYVADCERFGLPLPVYVSDICISKTIISEKLIRTTGYSFVYPDPRRFSYTI